MKDITVRGKRSDTAVWLVLNNFSPEDEEQAVGIENADLVQPADQQEAPKAPGSSLWLGLNFSLLQRLKTEKATGRGEGCSSKKEEVRVDRLQLSVLPA